MKMRIFVVEPTGQGGLVHYAYELCTGLANSGADVTLVTADEYELGGCPHNFRVERRLHLWKIVDSRAARKPPSSVLAKTWRRFWWTGRRVFRFTRLLGQWVRLTNYLIAEKPDVVLFGRFYFPGASFFLRKLKRHGLILADVCHEYESRDPNLSRINALIDRTTEFFERAAYKAFSAIFIHGEINRDRFLAEREVSPARVHVIQHGVSSLFFSQARHVGLAERYRLEPSEQVILFFGNLRVSKGIPDLLRAFALIESERYRARLLITGYPTQSVDVQELRRLARELGVEGRTIFDIRYIPNEEVSELMHLATVVAFPYISATQSGPLMIAHAFGRPVVATAVGNFPEVVKDGCTGFLVPPASPPALAGALRKILAAPNLARKMGEEAKRLADRRYSWNSVARDILAVLEQIASGPSGRAKTSSTATNIRTATR
jgi:glycosyltransferase involved in cell wall biosynthesis